MGYVNNNLTTSFAVLDPALSPFLDWNDHYATLVYEYGAAVDDKDLSIESGLDVTVSESITFAVTDGMDFYVVVQMSAVAKNGFANGMNTFTMNFDDNTGLTPAASAVPVPAAVWLFGTGLLGLIGTRKKVTV